MNFLDSDKPTFDKYGGYYHLRIDSTKDMQRLLDLTDGRWMATSCPLSGLNVDATFLKFLDADGNGRIISTEIRNAIRWIHKVLNSSDSWLQNKPSLSLDLINVSDPEAKILRDTATMILRNLNSLDSQEITLDQVRNRQKVMEQADYNGDGIIPPEAVKDAEASQFVRDILSVIEGVTDVSGLKGINEPILNQFLAEAKSYLEWYNMGAISEGQTETDIMPFGADTPNIFAVVARIRDKIEQFFAQCSFIRYKKLFSKEASLDKSTPDEIDYNDRNAILEYMSHAPVAKPNPEGILPLDEGLNDVYLNQIIALRDQVVKRIFGEEVFILNEQQWRRILSKFAAYEAWMKARPNISIENLGVDKIMVYSGSPCVQAIRELIAIDKSLADEVQQMQNLEKLLLYHQWLFEFVNNYVSFPHLFSIDQKAMFEMGSLILAGREFIFSIKVENITTHVNLAKNSGICLMYLHVTGSRPEEAFDIAVPVTRGGTSELYVGKRGVFFTRSGKEFDAQIVQIVDNPISLLESLKEPFRRVFSMIGTRFAQISSAIQKESEKAITTTATDQTTIQKGITHVQQQPSPTQEKAPAQTPTPQLSAQETTKTTGSTRDAMIGIGFLAAGLGTALKFLADTAKQLTQPETLRMLLIMIGIFLGITLIMTMFSALRKLHRRDFGVLLQASGWAINGKMRLIRPMAKLFCRKVKIPKGSRKHRKELLITIERLARKVKANSEEIKT